MLAEYWLEAATTLVATVALVAGWRKRQNKARQAFIEDYAFRARLQQRLATTYPHLTPAQQDLVLQSLREYFQICREARGRMIAMPSQAVDLVWHEFILFTREYDQFCRKGLGRFLHHTPAEAMQARTSAQQGIKRAWRIACLREGIDPHKPSSLPLLFALDALLLIPDGFHYSLDCLGKRSDNNYCATHIGCSSGCGGGCSSDSGSDSGCGGGGCGGD
ncbi:glycine-rich domain-containing protein [Marinobacterium jannaschii]|uniref:glycine-rich domain-containing protein n=1 Tax=Marinobacterium jannaschii TaxID=64970 RepID=UPI0005644BB3|nr:hypothetical protein [Marinobacterium jannaschii]